jgi:hypothetical protein
MRCGACKSWRGGKRGALKKSESTKKNKEHTIIVVRNQNKHNQQQWFL